MTDRSPCGDWLARLADYLSREDRFTTDVTVPDGVSTVSGLRAAAGEVERLREALEQIRIIAPDQSLSVGYALLKIAEIAGAALALQIDEHKLSDGEASE